MSDLLHRSLLGANAGERALDEEATSRRATPISYLRRLRLRGGADDGVAVLGVIVLVIVFIVSSFFSALEPNQYGLMMSYVTGNVSYYAYRGGLHVPGPLRTFVTFPAAQNTLEYSDSYGANRLPVETRTGADKTAGSNAYDERESGGQPIKISCALQYMFVPEKLLDVYLTFGGYEQAEQRYLLWAGNMVGNTAQDFTPQDFWTKRDEVAKKMLKEVNATLWEQGFVQVKQFEIIAIDFVSSFEQSITQVQVAEQKKVINKYDQKVQEVEQHIEVMKSHNEAVIANITAEADAKAKEICAAATRDAFQRKQSTKAKFYSELKSKLELNEHQMAQYLKIKALQGQETNQGKVVVGLPPIAEGPAPSTEKEPKKEASTENEPKKEPASKPRHPHRQGSDGAL
eukprot:TRINITY_DN20771_c0_g1_i1.p2 TRINITY_DN20771_c0_g1~~TRINITY_DN20771_c0_g1_i1.p2  ORF type:complete len:401 (-),score=134.17 TRINITY_DN20771_c0_g1_i1:97-1299(-)